MEVLNSLYYTIFSKFYLSITVSIHKKIQTQFRLWYKFLDSSTSLYFNINYRLSNSRSIKSFSSNSIGIHNYIHRIWFHRYLLSLSLSLVIIHGAKKYVETFYGGMRSLFFVVSITLVLSFFLSFFFYNARQIPSTNSTRRISLLSRWKIETKKERKKKKREKCKKFKYTAKMVRALRSSLMRFAWCISPSYFSLLHYCRRSCIFLSRIPLFSLSSFPFFFSLFQPSIGKRLV